LSSDTTGEVKRRISEEDPDRIEGILGQMSAKPTESKLTNQDNIIRINRLFASDAFEDILAALEADGSDWAMKESATLGTKSPQSCKVALLQLALGGAMTDFADNMRMEYRIGHRVLMKPDFAEGVRAVIVDKDNKPKWNPATAGGVTVALIDQIFAPLPAEEEWKPL
jgi:enoyl-CoA hydratase